MGSPRRRCRRRSLASVAPTEPLEIGSGLTLAPRLKLLLSFFRTDPAVRPVDEWSLKVALLDFLRSPPLSLPISDSDDVAVSRRPDLQKRRLDEPVASGILYVRDLSFLNPEDGEGAPRKAYLEWRASVVKLLEGIEVNVEGVKFRLSVEIPPSDDFEKMRDSWEDHHESKLLHSSSGRKGAAEPRPDTIVVGGVPSRWFAEPRVSSKASVLVTHTIFSELGKIRNLNVAGDHDSGKTQGMENMLSGLNCKVWVQFETHEDFYNAMNVLCGRSLQKEGSRLKVDYEITWDKDGYFQILNQRPMRNRLQGQKKPSSTHQPPAVVRKDHAPSRPTPYAMLHDPDGARRKRFRD